MNPNDTPQNPINTPQPTLGQDLNAPGQEPAPQVLNPTDQLPNTYAQIPNTEMASGVAPSSHRRNKPIIIIAVVLLVVILVVALFFLVFNNKSILNNGGILSATTSNSSMINSISVNSSATSGYQGGQTTINQADKNLGLEGMLMYTKISSTGYSVTSVSYEWTNTKTNSSSASSKLKQEEQAMSKVKSGVSFKKVGAPNISMKGSNGKTYILKCQGAVTTIPANSYMSAMTINGDSCAAKFDKGNQDLIFDASGTNAQAIASKFANATVLNLSN